MLAIARHETIPKDTKLRDQHNTLSKGSILQTMNKFTSDNLAPGIMTVQFEPTRPFHHYLK